MGRATIWHVWVISNLALSTYFGARWLGSPRPTEAPSASTPTTRDAQGRARFGSNAETPTEPTPNWLLARLDLAETGSELCELLGQLKPTGELATTYAITRVLDRTHFRSVRACAANALAAQPTDVAES